MSKSYFLRLFFLLHLLASGPVLAQTLKVSPNGRYLTTQDGKPFFYLGDTAWELFHRLNREEAEEYLRDRAKKGFTVIQAVVLAEKAGLTEPNPYGDLPLVNQDPTRPNEAYFRHVDFVVDKAQSLGLVVGMLPSWGSHWSARHPETRVLNPENAGRYGQMLGKRYRTKPVVWILGGDRNITDERERQTVEALARGLKEGDGGEHLMTFHPMGPGFSSDYFHAAPWLDFNMYQSSHGAHNHDNGLFAEHDYALKPTKPTLDGEPRYEGLVAGFYFDGGNRLDRFDDFDCRQAAYWSLLSGACGHTYGHGSVWQMYTGGNQGGSGPQVPWREALNHPGAFQMGLVRKLFTSRPFEKLVPAKGLIVGGPDSGGGKIKAALASDASFAFVYSPFGEQFSVDLSVFNAPRLREVWFDPRYGVEYPLHSFGTKGIQTYTPPTSGRGRDWVLIIETTE